MFIAYSNSKQEDWRIMPDTDYSICSVQNDSNGYPEFLIWSDITREWIWKSAKYFHL